MIYLLRHGTLEGDISKKYIGQMNIPLNDNGFRQAESWANNFLKQQLVFDSILSSDLVRCKSSADIIASSQKLEVKTLPALREINLGDWDGKERRQIKTKFPDAWGKHGTDPSFCPPNGESFADLQVRAVSVIEDISKSSNGKNILIVTHAGVIRCVICFILEIPLSQLFRIELNYAALCAINDQKKPLTMAYINRVNDCSL